MSRPKSYDPETVLDRATELFWSHGFHATSMRDVSDATNLRPGSLYGTFGGKRELFLAVLERYYTGTRDAVEEALGTAPDPLEGVRRFLEGVAEAAIADDRARGCLMVNTVLEADALEDDGLRQRVDAMFGGIEERLAGALEAARDMGLLESHRDPARLARAIIAAVYGLRVYQRRQPGPETLRELAAELLALLPPRSTTPTATA
ncbi:MAG: TetR/AcrR family transcriptional regulator [Pseudomonadota bacterium]